MVEQAAKDYAKILTAVDPSREINPINMTIDDMLARLDEFEQTLSNVKAENNSIIDTHISGIVAFQDEFAALRCRIDNLDAHVDRINANVKEMERKVEIAEAELNVPDYSLKEMLLKPLLAAATTAKASDAAASPKPTTNLDEAGQFQSIAIFSADELFGRRSDETTTVTK